MASTHELSEMIDALVREKTFSLDAIDAVKALRDKAKDLEQTIERRNGDLATVSKNAANMEREIGALKREIESLSKIHDGIAEREAKVVENEKLAAVAKAESAAYKHALETVFRPNTVRERVIDNIPIAVDSGGYSSVSTYSTSKDVVREEGN